VAPEHSENGHVLTAYEPTPGL